MRQETAIHRLVWFIAMVAVLVLWSPKVRAESATVSTEDAKEKSEELSQSKQTGQGQLAVTVGVPFYDESIIHGDITVDIRYGRKIWWLVPYFAGGFRQSRLDPARIPPEARRQNMNVWHMTMGLRLDFPVSERIVPVVGMSGELTHWGFEDNTFEYCNEEWYPDSWRCYKPHQWKAGRAFKAHVGMLYKPEPSVALEFLVEVGRAVAPEMFTRPVVFISPMVGFAWHH